MIRKATTLHLPDYLLADMHAEAKRRGVSVSRFVEEIAEAAMYDIPNAETQKAIEEVRSGVQLEELTSYDIEHLEEYVAAL